MRGAVEINKTPENVRGIVPFQSKDNAIKLAIEALEHAYKNHGAVIYKKALTALQSVKAWTEDEMVDICLKAMELDHDEDGDVVSVLEIAIRALKKEGVI